MPKLTDPAARADARRRTLLAAHARVSAEIDMALDVLDMMLLERVEAGPDAITWGSVDTLGLVRAKLAEIEKILALSKTTTE